MLEVSKSLLTITMPKLKVCLFDRLIINMAEKNWETINLADFLNFQPIVIIDELFEPEEVYSFI